MSDDEQKYPEEEFPEEKYPEEEKAEQVEEFTEDEEVQIWRPFCQSCHDNDSDTEMYDVEGEGLYCSDCCSERFPTCGNCSEPHRRHEEEDKKTICSKWKPKGKKNKHDEWLCKDCYTDELTRTQKGTWSWAATEI
jgi:hypothetical protein